MREGALLRQVERRLAKVPGLVWRKRHGGPFATAGDPDLYFLWAGQHWELELKRPGGALTPLQLLRLEQWATAGASTAVITSMAELEALLTANTPHKSGKNTLT